MANRGSLTKFAAIAGTVLLWLPVLFTVFTAVVGSVSDRAILFDYLLPAELSPFALAGGLLLLWASWQAKYGYKLSGGGLLAMIGFLWGGQAIAIATGLASGAIEPAGWPWLLVLASLALYTAALMVSGIAGILLLKQLYR